MKENLRSVFSLAAGGLLLAALLVAVGTATRSASADPGTLFAEPGGGGTACAQAQPCALQTAMTQATDGDTIYVAGGNYTGTGQAVITITKSITLYGGWDGTATTPPVRDSTLYSSTLDGEDQRLVVHISGSIAPTLDGFIITRGKGDFSGGGVKVENASPLIHDNEIVHNAAAGDGGAIFVNGGAAQIIGNRIISNTATWSGGLRIINDADATVLHNEIRDNAATNYGGGVDVDCCGGATVLIAGNFIADNDSGNAGGGVRINSTRAELINNILAHNQAATGDSISVGGTDSYPANALLIHNTVVGVASGDQAVWVGTYVTTTLTNNILTDHATGITNTAPSSSTIALDHNLLWNATDPITGTNAVLADPLLDAAFHLNAGSPAMDAGATVGVETDFDGDRRPIGPDYDIGADERRLYVYLPPVMKRYTDG